LLGALCVAAEVRQPGFWYEKVDRLNPRSGDRAIGSSGDLKPSADVKVENPKALESSNINSPEPAYQNNEVAAERQAAEIPPQEVRQQDTKDSHTRQIIISIPDRRLAFLVDGEVVKIYPVAVGKSETPSPEGEF